MRIYPKFLARLAFCFFCLFAGLSTSLLAQVLIKSGLKIKQVHFNNNVSGISETVYDLDLQSQDDPDFDLGQLKSLIQDNVPTIYLSENRIIDDNGENPIRLISDGNSLSLLEDQNEKYRTVKFLQVDLSQIGEKSQVKLDPEKLRAFSNLVFVFIKSTIPLTKEEVNLMLSGYELGDVVLLYQVNSNF
jgi:hypothetical protein